MAEPDPVAEGTEDVGDGALFGLMGVPGIGSYEGHVQNWIDLHTFKAGGRVNLNRFAERHVTTPVQFDFRNLILDRHSVLSHGWRSVRLPLTVSTRSFDFKKFLNYLCRRRYGHL